MVAPATVFRAAQTARRVHAIARATEISESSVRPGVKHLEVSVGPFSGSFEVPETIDDVRDFI